MVFCLSSCMSPYARNFMWTCFSCHQQQVRQDSAAARRRRHGSDDESRLEVRLHIPPELLSPLRRRPASAAPSAARGTAAATSAIVFVGTGGNIWRRTTVAVVGRIVSAEWTLIFERMREKRRATKTRNTATKRHLADIVDDRWRLCRRVRAAWNTSRGRSVPPINVARRGSSAKVCIRLFRHLQRKLQRVECCATQRDAKCSHCVIYLQMFIALQPSWILTHWAS